MLLGKFFILTGLVLSLTGCSKLGVDLGNGKTFSKRVQELRSFEFQVVDLKREVANLEAQMAIKDGKIHELNTKLDNLLKERKRTIANTASNINHYDLGITAYQNKKWNVAERHFGNYLSSGQVDQAKGPKALLWTVLIHGRTKNWKAYQENVAKLKRIYPKSQEAKLLDQMK